jgi:hypothetical protein
MLTRLTYVTASEQASTSRKNFKALRRQIGPASAQTQKHSCSRAETIAFRRGVNQEVSGQIAYICIRLLYVL